MATLIEATDLVQYLTFAVGDEDYGISVLSVREILEYDTVTRVPRTPDFIRGVINLRGRVVPVIDLAVRFGLAPRPVTKRTCVVIAEVEVEGKPEVMGLVADAVSQVIELGPGEIEPPPSFGTPVDIAYLKGMGRMDRRFVLLLDIDRVLSARDSQEAAALIANEDGAARCGGEGGALGSLVASALLLLSLGAPTARAQEPIQDNSFLVEEAYNQERGVVQHIGTFSRSAGEGDWVSTFTQEWPVPDERHQVSFTLPVQEVHASRGARRGLGDVALNYRYQAIGNGKAAVAFSPRLSLLVPTGRSGDGLGAGGLGLQICLPLSTVLGSRFVAHWNAGATRTFSGRDAAGDRAATTALSVGQSLVWLAAPRVNLLLETSWTRADAVVGPNATTRSNSLLVSPGIRWAHDFRSGLQIVPGLAVPIGVGPSRGEHALFVYLSFEHPFRATGH